MAVTFSVSKESLLYAISQNSSSGGGLPQGFIEAFQHLLQFVVKYPVERRMLALDEQQAGQTQKTKSPKEPLLFFLRVVAATRPAAEQGSPRGRKIT
jgi:hypothetical protein